MLAFARPALAQSLVAALQGESVFGDEHNGLFLAAPRRTGKSTFLQHDLAPALQAKGITVVYVDLWADPRRDPGSLIAEAIGTALQQHLGIVARTARKAGLDKVKVAGLEVDTSKIGQTSGLTLAQALGMLIDHAGQPVALIIDEAQHALTSEAGEAAMTALKSARDQLNKPGKTNLMIVMSGSDRDKLLRLVNTSGAAFFGSQIQRMPPLGADFIAHIATLIEAQRKDLAPVDQAKLTQAFAAFGHRPQFFMSALGQALSPLRQGDEPFEDALLEASAAQVLKDEAQMESDYLGLKPTERAVLWRILDQGQNFRPYDASALQFYAEKVGKPCTTVAAQRALESLRDRSPALVWKSARGEYAVADAQMHAWFATRVAAGTWPPRSPTTSPLDDDL